MAEISHAFVGLGNEPSILVVILVLAGKEAGVPVCFRFHVRRGWSILYKPPQTNTPTIG